MQNTNINPVQKLRLSIKLRIQKWPYLRHVTIFNRSMINLENETVVLNSFCLNKKAVQELKFNVKYFHLERLNDLKITFQNGLNFVILLLMKKLMTIIILTHTLR